MFSRVSDAALQRSRAELIRLQPGWLRCSGWPTHATGSFAPTALDAILLLRALPLRRRRLIGVAVEEAQSHIQLSSSLEDTARIGAEILNDGLSRQDLQRLGLLDLSLADS